MNVTVVLPVGPESYHSQWLYEALESVRKQTLLPVEVLLVNDSPYRSLLRDFPFPVNVYRPPWRLGVAHAFNAGVALAPTECVFMMGADDTIEPECLERCYGAYMAHVREGEQDIAGYFSVSVRYMDTGEIQTLPCHAAMVTKSLWHLTGGLPTEAATGASDAALLSIMIGNYPNAGRIFKVAEGVPLYNYRRHDASDTASKGPWQGVILETRNLVTAEWKSPSWSKDARVLV